MAPGWRLPLEAEADDLRDQHGHGLPEHRGFGLDAADAPAEHAEAVDHGGVRVGADQRVGIGAAHAVGLGVEDHAAEVLEVHLVHDAGVGRHDREVAERGLAPAQERVALAVARELDGGVGRERAGGAVLVDLHGVVDDELGGCERIDALGIAAEAHDRIAHRGQVDDAGHAGEVLQDDARRREGDFVRRGGRGIPVEQRLDVRARDADAVLEAQQILEQDLQGVGQARELVLRQSREAPDLVSSDPPP